MKAQDVPVLLIAFNRPREMRAALDALRVAKPKSLYVSVDAARPSKSGEAESVAEVIDLLKTVDWDCDVKLQRHETNLGCCDGPVAAISCLFENVEAGIILEDDCIPDPTFFEFCGELLDKYADDTRVGMIAGSSTGLKLQTGASYGFSKYSYIWGWATWRRAWNLFDPVISKWPEIERAQLLEAVISNPRELNFWKPRFASVYHRTETTIWDYQWMIAHFLHRMVCIVPAVNLINNIGSGPGSTHMNPFDLFLHRETSPMPFPLVHPNHLVVDVEADEEAMRERFSLRPLHRRVVSRIKREVIKSKGSRAQWS